MSISQSFPTESAPGWAIIIAEKFNSAGGSAGDGLTVNIESTTPANKHIFIFTNDFNRKYISGDTITHFTNKGGQMIRLKRNYWKCSLKNCHIPAGTMAEVNKLVDQLRKWIDDGNSQASPDQVYMAVRKKNASAVWEFLTWEVLGVKQNWIKGEIKGYGDVIDNAQILAGFDFEGV